jgi:ABC-type glutathione transport system ATPase component
MYGTRDLRRMPQAVGESSVEECHRLTLNSASPPVSRLSKSYGSASNVVKALEDVSIGIRSGEFTAIMGPSRSGESTLMHIMAGLDTATSGAAWVGFEFHYLNLVPTPKCGAISCCRSNWTGVGPRATSRPGSTG